MNPGSILLGIGLLAATVIYVGSPFFLRPALQKSKSGAPSGSAGDGDAAARKKNALYALSDLDFDFKANKVTEEDYQAMRASLVGEVAQLMEKDKREGDEIEALIAARRKPQPAAARPEAFCAHCGKPLALDANFCGHCGAAVKQAACAACGAQIQPDDRFCPACGKPVPTASLSTSA